MRRFDSWCRVAAGIAVLPAALLAPAGAADPAADHERAQAARARGEVLPLAQILARIERDFAGRVIEVELEREDGSLRYEIELLLPDGRLVELEYDARSGELVKIEGTRLETVFRQRPGPKATSR